MEQVLKPLLFHGLPYLAACEADSSGGSSANDRFNSESSGDKLATSYSAGDLELSCFYEAAARSGLLRPLELSFELWRVSEEEEELYHSFPLAEGVFLRAQAAAINHFDDASIAAKKITRSEAYGVIPRSGRHSCFISWTLGVLHASDSLACLFSSASRL